MTQAVKDAGLALKLKLGPAVQAECFNWPSQLLKQSVPFI